MANPPSLFTYDSLPSKLFIATVHSKNPSEAQTISDINTCPILKNQPIKTLVKMPQKHTTTVFHLQNLKQTIPTCDALITQIPLAALSISHADCQATCIYDPCTKTVAAIHAGWRGQVAGIYTATIKKMVQLGSRAGDLQVIMAPSLGPCCAQIKDPPSNFTKQHLAFANQELFFNLWEMAKWEMTSLGIQQDNIQLPPFCTLCSPSFHSYRRDKTQLRNYTVIQLLNLQLFS